MGSIDQSAQSGRSELYMTIHKTAAAYTLSQEKARDEGPSALYAVCEPTCRRYVRPVSLLLQPPGHLVQEGESNEQYAERWMMQLEQTTRGRDTEIKDIVVDEAGRKAVTRHVHYVKHKNGQREFPFEVVSFLDVNAAGTRIEKIVQVLDTQMAEAFWRENRSVQDRLKAKLQGSRQPEGLRRGSQQSSLVGAMGNKGDVPTTPTSGKTPKFERTYSWRTEGRVE